MNRQSNQARQSYVLSNTVSYQSSPKLLHTTVSKGNDSLQESMCCACCLFCTSHKIVPQESYDSLLITQYGGRGLCCW